MLGMGAGVGLMILFASEVAPLAIPQRPPAAAAAGAERHVDTLVNSRRAGDPSQPVSLKSLLPTPERHADGGGVTSKRGQRSGRPLPLGVRDVDAADAAKLQSRRDNAYAPRASRGWEE